MPKLYNYKVSGPGIQLKECGSRVHFHDYHKILLFNHFHKVTERLLIRLANDIKPERMTNYHR